MEAIPQNRRKDSDIPAFGSEEFSLIHPDDVSSINGIVSNLSSGNLNPDEIEAERLRLLTLVNNIASTDHMTGLKNSRAVERILQQYMDYCRNSNTPLSVIFIDGNGFGQINKHPKLGQQFGDKIITLMGKAVKEATRGKDVQARLGDDIQGEKVTLDGSPEGHGRMGGDEFALILPGATLKYTPQIFQRFLSIFQNLVDSEVPEYREVFNRPITATGGSAQYDLQTDNSPLHLMSRADSAMRYGKQNQGLGLFVQSVREPFSGVFENQFPPETPNSKPT